MKKLSIAFFLFLGLISTAKAQQSVVIPATMFSVPITGAINSPNDLVLASGQVGKSIYVTAVDLVPAATAAVQFTQGTGANCSTGKTTLTGSMVFSAGQTYMKGDGFGTFWVLLPGNSLCISIGTALAPGSLAYAIF